MKMSLFFSLAVILVVASSIQVVSAQTCSTTGTCTSGNSLTIGTTVYCCPSGTTLTYASPTDCTCTGGSSTPAPTSSPGCSAACTTTSCPTTDTLAYNAVKSYYGQCNSGAGVIFQLTQINFLTTDGSTLQVVTRDVNNLATSPNSFYYGIGSNAMGPTGCFDLGSGNRVVSDVHYLYLVVKCLTSTGCAYRYGYTGAGCLSPASSPATSAQLYLACAQVNCGANGNCNSAGSCVCTNGYSGTTCQTPPADTTPPVRSNGSPTGSLIATTTTSTMAVTTNEAATCRYSTTANTLYSAISSTMTGGGGTSHSATLSGLLAGSTYTYYVRCMDAAANANTDDYAITFSIHSSATPAPTVISYTSKSFNGQGCTGSNLVRTDIFTSGQCTINPAATSTSFRITYQSVIDAQVCVWASSTSCSGTATSCSVRNNGACTAEGTTSSSILSWGPTSGSQRIGYYSINIILISIFAFAAIILGL